MFSYPDMANSHLLSLTQEKFEIFLTNLDVENSLKDDDISSASFFKTPVNLDVQPLLYLRSASAKLSLSYLTIDQLALAFTSSESLSIVMTTPEKILETNTVITKRNIVPTNELPFTLQFSDFTATTPQAPLEYMNGMFANINSFLIYRLSLAVFDKDIFKEGLFQNASIMDPIELSPQEVDILLRYVDAMAFCRRLLHVILSRDDRTSKPEFKFTNIKPLLSEDLERATLDNSRILKSLVERTAYESKKLFHLTNFPAFYKVDLSEISEKRRTLATRLTSHLREVLHDCFFIDLDNPSPNDKTLINNMLASNLKLLSQATTLRQILTVERGKLDPSFAAPLFNADFLSVSLDESAAKTKFNIMNRVFLPPDETEITISIPPRASYTLGCDPAESYIRIGPISFDSDTFSKKTPNLTNLIMSRTQRLRSSIRHHPKLIRVCTDVLSSSENKQLWPADDEFAGFQTLYCQTIDESTYQQRFIHKTSTDLDFHRMLRSQNTLESLTFLLQDECGKIVYFPRNTYVFAAFRLEPICAKE